MTKRIYPMLEHPISGVDVPVLAGEYLARVVDAHPVLAELLDYSSTDPVEIAREIGMVFPGEEDAEEDLAEIDLGPRDWYEPSAGIAAVHHALTELRRDPGSLARAIYDPELQPADVIADLESIEKVLVMAQEYETRFHFVVEDEPLPWQRG